MVLQRAEGERKKTEGMGKEDERTEAAISSTPLLQPNYKPKGITQDQLSKFQELHRRRLQIKSKSKIGKKPKGCNRKSHRKDWTVGDSETQDSIENSAVIRSVSHKNESSSSAQKEDVAVQAPTKQKKLHWGLDTKERWERKANM